MYRKALPFAFCFVLFCALAVPRARATSYELTVTTNGPLEVPGRVLSPGKYELRPLDSSMDTGFFTLYTSRGRFIGNYPVVPDYGDHVAARAKVALQKEPGSPERIMAWFYPGSHTGYEFLYPATTAGPMARMETPQATVNR